MKRKVLSSVMALLYHTIYISGSSTPYNVYNYDLANPLFTPDGLIKQVEYASDAASQSSPIIIFPFLTSTPRSTLSSSISDQAERNICNDPKDIELALIVASISSATNQQKSDKKQEILSRDEGSESHRRGQHRIITLPISVPYSHLSGKSSSSNEIILGLNGILPDSMELVSLARDHLFQTLSSSYGIHKLHHSSISYSEGIVMQPFMASSCSSAYTIAQFIASKCQERSFGGGIRPFGSTIIVCGIDYVVPHMHNDYSSGGKDWSMMRLFVVDPSGKVTSLSYSSQSCQTPNDQDTDLLFIVGGNDETARDLLRHHAHSYISSRIRQSSNIIRLHIEATLSALRTLSLREEKQSTIEQRALDNNFNSVHNSKLRNNRSQSHEIELVLVTAQGGVQRLSDDQIEKLLDEIN